MLSPGSPGSNVEGVNQEDAHQIRTQTHHSTRKQEGDREELSPELVLGGRCLDRASRHHLLDTPEQRGGIERDETDPDDPIGPPLQDF